MKVRGAPLIGATAAYGIYLAFKELKNKRKLWKQLQKLKRQDLQL